MKGTGLTSPGKTVREALHVARRAQQTWEQVPVEDRARRVGKLGGAIAEHAEELAAVCGAVDARPIAEKLVSEILPLADACRFIGKRGAKILRVQKFGSRHRPWWLRGSVFEIQRKPFGVVLVVGPRNYPLFLPLVQTLQAIAAGNAVLLKPAGGASAPVLRFLELVVRPAGIPAELIGVLPEAPEAAHEAVNSGADKVVFTGSSENGRDLLATMATRNTPGVMELSGADAVFVLREADVERAAKAIAFGIRLNDGNTCMVPHAVIADENVAASLRRELDALGLAHLEITIVAGEREALDLAASSEQGLGASVFSRNEIAARNFARELHTGFVTINDLIVPTADPRFPFGGARGSGYGVTRGAEGLLEMTYPHVVAWRSGGNLPHLKSAKAGDADIFASYLQLMHVGGARTKFEALRRLFAAVRAR